MTRRNTKQRQLILEAVQSRCDHPSAEQIFRQVREKDPKISLGTVYRNLAILAEEGKLLDLRLSEADRFDRTTAPHDHFFCENCGRIFDICQSAETQPVIRLCAEPLSAANSGSDACVPEDFAPDGFVIRSHQTLYRGVCPICAAKGKTAESEQPAVSGQFPQ